MNIIVVSKSDAGHFRAGRKWDSTPHNVEVIETPKGLKPEELKAFHKKVLAHPDQITDTDLVALKADSRIILVEPTMPAGVAKAKTVIAAEKANEKAKDEELATKREAGEKAAAKEKRKTGR